MLESVSNRRLRQYRNTASLRLYATHAMFTRSCPRPAKRNHSAWVFGSAFGFYIGLCVSAGRAPGTELCPLITTYLDSQLPQHCTGWHRAKSSFFTSPCAVSTSLGRRVVPKIQENAHKNCLRKSIFFSQTIFRIFRFCLVLTPISQQKLFSLNKHNKKPANWLGQAERRTTKKSTQHDLEQPCVNFLLTGITCTYSYSSVLIGIRSRDRPVPNPARYR